MLIIRLRKRGRKKLNIYDIVVTNKRSARDGKYIEKIGTYNPVLNPSKISLNEELTLKWLNLGSEISETVRNILSNAGIMLKWHLDKCIKKGSLTEEKKKTILSEWTKNNKNKKSHNSEYIFLK